MVKAFPKGTRQLLNALSGTDYIITGSLALHLKGFLERPIKDIDLISTDPQVLEILRSKGFDLSEAFENERHHRFHFKDILFVDIFVKDHTPYELVQFRNKILKVTPPWYIYHNKLTDRFNNKKKAMEDVQYFFGKLGEKWQGDYM